MSCHPVYHNGLSREHCSKKDESMIRRVNASGITAVWKWTNLKPRGWKSLF